MTLATHESPTRSATAADPALVRVFIRHDACDSRRFGAPDRTAFREQALRELRADRRMPAEFVQEPGGRPRLVGPAGHHADISASSTGGAMVCAVSIGTHIGVDIERHRPDLIDDAMLAEALTPAEQIWCQRGTDLPVRFHHLWCRKEAVLKGLGLGLSLPPRAIDVVSCARLGGWTAVATPRGVWHVRSLDVGPGLTLAVATSSAGADIELVAR